MLPYMILFYGLSIYMTFSSRELQQLNFVKVLVKIVVP